MKINKWTLGLAAVGLVSLTSVARADEAKTTPLLTALSATTISGYIDTSMVWNPGTGNANPAPFKFNAGKQDGFNLDSVDLRIAKPLEEGQWSSGYCVDLMFGPDANATTGEGVKGSGIGEHVRQAYLNLRMPVGNGLDWKIGRFDSPLGYESTDSYKNPNFTRSYGFSLEPSELTGVMAEYKFNETAAASIGIANTENTGTINGRNVRGIESKKAVFGMINLTAPESWGAIGGSGLYAGAIYGSGAAQAFVGAPHDTLHAYVGATVKTPVQGLTLGVSLDSVNHYMATADVTPVIAGVPFSSASVKTGADAGYVMAVAAYASMKLSDKASVHVRAEYAHGSALASLGGTTVAVDPTDATAVAFANEPFTKVIALTGTLQYDLWQNVISRLEVRWDHAANGGATPFGGTVSPGVSTAPDLVVGSGPTGTKKNDVMVAANLIFKF
jgi:hypothetical protein